ncbi:hypothetical protein BH10ACT3_BH10ACT3_01940 [soil metagenome]
MALLQPTTAATGVHRRVRISLPSAAAAAEIGVRSGGHLRLGDVPQGGGRECAYEDVALVVQEVVGRRIVASGDVADPGLLRLGRSLVLSWTELNDWASVIAHVDGESLGRLSLSTEWPPIRRQRREFRRFMMKLPLSISSGVLSPTIHGATTRDVSAGGIAAQVSEMRWTEGDAVAAMLRCDGRDVLAAATIKWVRPSTRMLALEFSLITPADQDYLVGLVAQAEARRGW